MKISEFMFYLGLIWNFKYFVNSLSKDQKVTLFFHTYVHRSILTCKSDAFKQLEKNEFEKSHAHMAHRTFFRSVLIVLFMIIEINVLCVLHMLAPIHV